MPTKPTHAPITPAYCRQRVRGGHDRAYVALGGKRHWLGRWNSDESRSEYRRIVAEWLSTGGTVAAPPARITVAEVCAAFKRHAAGYYARPDGSHTSELSNFQRVIDLLDPLYGDRLVTEFGPVALRTLRDEMIGRGWCRKTINGHVSRIRQVFKWAASHQLVPPSVWHALVTVDGLKRGRSAARESEPVKPVPAAYIDAVRPFVSRQVEALIDLQLLTGARPGELTIMRGADLDTSGQVWTYTPQRHKTEHHGHKRTIYIGPRAQEIITQFLKPDTGAYLFDPRDAEAERRAEIHEQRRTPAGQGNRPGSNRVHSAERAPGDHYTTDSYRRCIARACAQAFPPPDHLARQRVPARGRKANQSTRWESTREHRARIGEKGLAELHRWRADHDWHPHQLRHNAATALRREHGIDLAQTILGHRLGSAITEIYAEANVEKAKSVMALAG